MLQINRVHDFELVVVILMTGGIGLLISIIRCTTTVDAISIQYAKFKHELFDVNEALVQLTNNLVASPGLNVLFPQHTL